MSNVQRAFEDWYRNSEHDDWWCVNCEDYHLNDCPREFAEPVTIVPSDYRVSLVSYEEAIAASDEVSEFATSLSDVLISDDAVDINVWLATHSVDE